MWRGVFIFASLSKIIENYLAVNLFLCIFADK